MQTVYDLKGWYCAKATSIVITSKQRKLAKEYGNLTEQSGLRIVWHFLQGLPQRSRDVTQHLIQRSQGFKFSTMFSNAILHRSEYSKVSRQLITIFWRCEEYFVKTPMTHLSRLLQNSCQETVAK